MKATYKNSFCMNSHCIHYFEDMCMVAMAEEGIEIEPMTSSPRIKDCPEFSLGTFLVYEVDLEEEDFR